MREFSLSLWLPVARANFYSPTVNGWLVKRREAGVIVCESRALARADYVPRLQVSVLRRVLEVLPRSFGYDPQGHCELSQEVDEINRPISVSVRLVPALDLAQRPDCPERRANVALVEAGIREVRLRVDENGTYTFTATLSDPANEETVRLAMSRHVQEVFGGGYSLDRLTSGPRHRKENEGGAAVKRYNGIAADSQVVVSTPLGILSFFQLNILVEGMFNESLTPAVFFEQDEFMRSYLRRPEGATSVVRTIGRVVELLTVEVDASRPDGQLVVLHRFLEVTSREVLQRLKWSVESVRRSLLDEMMSMLHRQSRLVQLNLGASHQELTPELAEGASESQLRGYVMLTTAKLPLIINVHDVATLALDHLGAVVSAGPTNAHLAGDLELLRGQLRHWKSLLDGLTNNVQGLEGAIGHAWRERLLYEQEQVRSEQEAMAEIERSRNSRPVAERASRTAYNAVMLVLTAAAVLLTIKTTNVTTLDEPTTTWWDLVVGLWPIGVLAVIAYLVVPGFSSLMRLAKERRGDSDSYPYEFAFRVDEPADPAKVFAYLRQATRRTPESPLPGFTITNSAGGRIERVSLDTTLVKVHSIAVFRVSRRRYARFEIVHEIRAHKASGRTQYVIIQSRMFGDSPRPLTPAEVREFVRGVLTYTGHALALDGSFDVAGLIELVDPLYTGQVTQPATAAEDVGPADNTDEPPLRPPPQTYELVARR